MTEKHYEIVTKDGFGEIATVSICIVGGTSKSGDLHEFR